LAVQLKICSPASNLSITSEEVFVRDNLLFLMKPEKSINIFEKNKSKIFCECEREKSMGRRKEGELVFIESLIGMN